jgi:uncharacterized protein (TIGR02246 family)
MKSATTLLILGSCVPGLLIGLGPAALQAGQEPVKVQPGVQGGSDRPADEAALRAVVAEFVRAFNAGDAATLAGLFTEAAEVVTVSGQRIEGRAAIEKQFGTAFAENPGQTIEVKTEAVRFLGPEVAVEDGTATTTGGQATGDVKPAPEITRYTAAYVKREGKWLHDSIRDFAASREPRAEQSVHEQLKVLEALIGEWIDESDEGEVHTTCRWADNGAFLLREFQVRIRGQEAMSGSQRVGWDPHLKQIRSWVFDSDGGFSEGLWSRDGDRFVIKTHGVLKDGRSASATNILTFVSRDMLKWASVDRTLGAEVLPDAEVITLVRKPPRPRSSPAAARPSQPGRTQP